MAMQAKIGTGVLELRVDDKDAKQALDQFKKRSADAANDIRGISQAVNLGVFKELASVAAGAFKAIVGGIAEMGERGSAVDDVASTFETLTARTQDTAAAMLGALREGVAGTMSDFDLMTTANAALGSGFIKSAADAATLAGGARALAESGLGSLEKNFESVISAISSGRTAQLKQLGLFVDAKVAVENYARANQKSVSDLTDADRAQALAAATLDALKKRQEELGPITADWGDRVAQAKTAVANFTDALAVGISRSPVFGKGLEAAAQGIQAAFSANQGQAIKLIVGLVEELALGLAQAGRIGLSVAEWVATAFQSVKITVNTVLAAVYESAGTVNDFLAELAERASSLPVVGKGFAIMAQQMRAGAEGARHMAQGFRDLANEQAASTVQMQGAFAVAGQVVDGVIAGMQKGRGEVEITAAATKRAIVEDMTGGPTAELDAKAQANAKAIGDAYRALETEVALLSKTGLERRLAELDAEKAAAIQKAQERKGATQQQITEELLLIDEKYRLLREKALLNGQSLNAIEAQLKAELDLLSASETEKNLARIEQERVAKLAALEGVKVAHPQAYAAMEASVNAAYGRMMVAAVAKEKAELDLLRAASQVTADEYNKRAAAIEAAYKRILEAGLTTTQQISDEEKKANDDAKKGAEDKTAGKLKSEEAFKTGLLQVYGVLANKYKEVAIAGAVIDAYKSIQKALASAPWPANLALAAGAAAVAWQNVDRIRGSAGGFAKGTPGLDFMNFGAVSWQPLHHEEAVIPRGGGHLLASEIADSMPGDGAVASRLDRVIALLERNPRERRRALREAEVFAV